ncbi:hypothetical protein GW17_00061490, partial [Ensete ventricosum]
ANSGTNPGDLAERANSGTNHGDLAERANSGTNHGDLVKRTNSGTNLGDLVERANSGINHRDLAERANSGTNPGDLAERANSGINHGHLAERTNSGTNLGDLAERENSGSNPGDLAERMHSGSNPGDLAERTHTWVPRYSDAFNALGGFWGDDAFSDAPGMCVSVDALEASLWFPLHPLIEECRWWRISPSQVAPNSWRYLVVFLDECQGAGIIPTRDLFMAYKMDLNDLRGMPKVSGDKAPPARPTTQEVGASPAREALKASSKRPVDTPAEQAEDPTRRHKKVKVLTRRHKSYLGEGESRSRSKGKEPIAPSEESDTPVESEEGALHQDEGQMERAEELDEGLERLVGNRGVQEGTSPPSTSAGALHAPLGGPAGPSRQGNGFGKFLTYALVP